MGGEQKPGGRQSEAAAAAGAGSKGRLVPRMSPPAGAAGITWFNNGGHSAKATFMFAHTP